MADEADMQATSNEEATVENTAESHTEEESTATDTQQSEQAAESSADASTNHDAADDQKSEAKDDSKPANHQSRRSSKYMADRIEYLAKENANLKRERQATETQDDWEAPAEDETQPDIQALIAAEVEKRLHPVISESTKAADDGEIAELFSGDKFAERTAYEPKIREMWQLPQYKDVAAHELYKIAKYDDLANSMDSVRQQAIEDYKKAAKEAKESSASGTSKNSNLTDKSGKSLSDMTDDELRAHNERVKAGIV